MADPIRVAIDQQQLDEIRNLIYSTRKGADTALYRSINHGARQGRKAAVDAMYAKVNLTKTKIRAETFVYFASISNLSAKMTVKNSLKGIEEFSASQTQKGVTFRLWRDGTRERYRHAFITTMPGSSTPRVYERNIEHGDYDGRLPVRRKFGPGIATVFDETPGVEEKVDTTASQAMLTELSRQINLLMGI